MTTVNRRAALVVVPVGGGPEEVLTSDLVPRGQGGYGGGAFAWVPDGRALVVAAAGDLWLVSRDGGPARRLTEHGAEGRVGAPAVAPDGTRVAYTRDLRDVAVVSLAERRRMAGAAVGRSRLRRRPRLVVRRRTRPVADVGRPGDALGREPDRVAGERWQPAPSSWCTARPTRQSLQAQPSPVAPATTALLTDGSGWLNVTVVGPDGRARPLVAEPAEHGTPTWVQGQRSFAWSPDGRRIAFTRNERGFGRLCVVDVDAGDAAEGATGPAVDVAKGWHESLTWQRRHPRRRAQRRQDPDAAGHLRHRRRGSGPSSPTVRWPAGRRTSTSPSWSAGPLPTVPSCTPACTGRGVPVTGTGSLPPLLVWTHGGPTSQWPVAFQARIAYFVAGGWAVLRDRPPWLHRPRSGLHDGHARALGRPGRRRHRWPACGPRSSRAGATPGASWPSAPRPAGSRPTTSWPESPSCSPRGSALYGVADLLHLDETSHRFERHYLHTIVGPLPGDGRAVPRAVAGEPRRAHHRAAARPAGQRRRRGAAGPVAGHRRSPPRTSGARWSTTSTTARATGGRGPRP